MNKKQRLKKLSFTDKIIIVFVTLLSVFFLIVFAVPIIYILTASVSTASSRILLDILPTKFVFEGYSFLFEDDTVLRALWNSVMYTSIGVAVTMAMTVLSAYPLSVHDFFIGKHMSGFFIFTLYFNGGMIPTYLLVKSLGLLNSMWSLILPSCISVTSIMLLTATFSKNNSKELFAAASLDGCGHWRYLFKILIPMCKPTILMLSFFAAVSYWNSYFDVMIYITDSVKWPLSMVLHNILIKNQEMVSSDIANNTSLISLAEKAELIQYALIVVSSLPVMVVSFFISKESGINLKKKNEK